MLFDFKDCGGCRTCEIACSFQKMGEFNHHFAAVEVVEKKDGTGYDLKIYDKPEDEHTVCDGCLELEEPPCVQYCREDDDLRRIINEYRAILKEKEAQRKAVSK